MTALERQGGRINIVRKRLCTGRYESIVEVQTLEDIKSKESKDEFVFCLKTATVIGLSVGIITLLFSVLF